MNLEESFNFLKVYHGSHSAAARALGWDVRRYRRLRRENMGSNDAKLLVQLMAEKTLRECEA